MTQEEKLDILIEKARDGGYKEVKHFKGRNPESSDIMALLFSHFFAKSIWGEEKVIALEDKDMGWEYNIKRAVISEDPISYYYENL